MDIQEVVLSHTGALQTTRASCQDLPESLHRHHDASDVLVLGRSPLPQDPTEIRRQVGTFATQLSAIERTGSDVGSGAEVFAALLQYLENPDCTKDLSGTISRACSRLELACLLDRFENSINFLDYIWGEDLERKISKFTGTRTQTVREWIGGKRPALYNQEMIYGATTVLHQLSTECGMSRDEARRYFEEVRFGHSDDRRLKHKSLWEWTRSSSWIHKRISYDRDLQDHIRDLGGDTEVFDHRFRHRFLIS